MPCENYREALSEAAATGAAPSPALRTHIDACTSCRAVFAEELQLFAAIDSGVHTVVNAEVPASLLPRVRASLETETVAKSWWFTNRFLLAGAAAAALTLAVSLGLWRSGAGTVVEPVHSTTNQAVPSLPTAKNQTPVPAPRAGDHPADNYRPTIAANRATSRVHSRSEDMPEVLVARDQEVLLVSYAAEWGRHKRAPLLAEDSREQTVKPLEVAPIQIAQLDVKLLAEQKSQ
jgi:hypothetical protein